MKHISRTSYLLAGIAAVACILAGCSSPLPTSGQADTETLYQVALLQSLMLGNYTGSITVKQLKHFGGTGLGAFDRLDGEAYRLFFEQATFKNKVSPWFFLQPSQEVHHPLQFLPGTAKLIHAPSQWVTMIPHSPRHSTGVTAIVPMKQSSKTVFLHIISLIPV